MGCKQLFVNLGGSGGSSPDGMLQTPAALSGTLQAVKDNLGNTSALSLSTTNAGFEGPITVGISGVFAVNFFNTNVKIQRSGASGLDFYTGSAALNMSLDSSGDFLLGNGTITKNGKITIKGSGGNLQSWRNSSNVEVGVIDSAGVTDFLAYSIGCQRYRFNSGVTSTNHGYLKGISNGIIAAVNAAENDFTRWIFGSNDTNGASLVKNGTALQVKDGIGTTFTTIEPLEILTRAPSGGTAKKIKFGERIAVTEGALTALGIDSQWLVEIDATNYYILGGTTQFS
jgi:hypothetical protein